MTDPMTPERLAEVEARLTVVRLGRSYAMETDADLRGIRALAAEVRRLQAAVERVRALAEGWRYKGEFGWGAWHGPDESGLALDDAACKILRALDGADDE